MVWWEHNVTAYTWITSVSNRWMHKMAFSSSTVWWQLLKCPHLLRCLCTLVVNFLWIFYFNCAGMAGELQASWIKARNDLCDSRPEVAMQCPCSVAIRLRWCVQFFYIMQQCFTPDNNWILLNSDEVQTAYLMLAFLVLFVIWQSGKSSESVQSTCWRPVMHAPTLASYSAVYRFGSLTDKVFVRDHLIQNNTNQLSTLRPLRPRNLACTVNLSV